MENSDLINALKRKAEGYEVEETTSEYAIDEEGNRKLIKERTSSKIIPPDTAALKYFIELSEKNDLKDMTDEELLTEKERLLRLLK